MKVILWRRPDGGFSWTHVDGDETFARQHASDLLAAEGPDEHGNRVRPYEGWIVEGVVDATEMPHGWPVNPDSAALWVKPAWDVKDGKPVIDMPRARDVHRMRLRDMRGPLLAALDVEYQRADEAGDADNKRRVAAKKQALRDVTKDAAIDAATTPEELKAAIPAVLVG